MGVKEHCTIPIELTHIPALTRIDAAVWAMEEFGPDSVDVLRPMSKRVVEGPNLCNEVMMVPCFWFKNQKDANWFALRWL